MFIFSCPNCKSNFRAEDEWIGQQITCPDCGQTVIITDTCNKQKLLILAISIPCASVLFLVMVIVGASSGTFGDTIQDFYFNTKYALLDFNFSRPETVSSRSVSSSFRRVRITADGIPKYSARYEIYVNGSLETSSEESSGYWNTNVSLKKGDTIYAKVLFKNGFGAVAVIEYSYKTTVGSDSVIDLETSQYRTP